MPSYFIFQFVLCALMVILVSKSTWHLAVLYHRDPKETPPYFFLCFLAWIMVYAYIGITMKDYTLWEISNLSP